ncbi:STAS domain-containing protein [Pseudoalteromonas spongiae]|uniref:STAS domain-containing protein n=1 Tax=Pseudoalteromonas spongiae TaxID=298657 RepID=UPI000C2D1854|nr:STAS domain-containing protein [Pseudoalteromonas spongiae]
MSLLTLKVVDDTTYVLSGELNRYSVPSVKLPKIPTQSTLTLDLSEVAKVDTAGLAWLIYNFSQLQRNNISLKLVHLPEQLKKLMQLGHVENLFE